MALILVTSSHRVRQPFPRYSRLSVCTSWLHNPTKFPGTALDLRHIGLRNQFLAQVPIRLTVYWLQNPTQCDFRALSNYQ